MARIKKQGLDYFPIGIDFMQNRLVRRILKREGDGALAALLAAYSAIYGGNGYYVNAGDDFCADIADSLYTLDPSDVESIVALAVEYGLFDAGLYRSCGILTSAEIQRQYVHSTRSRGRSLIDPRHLLLPAADAPGKEAETIPASTGPSAKSAEAPAEERAQEEGESAGKRDLSPINAPKSPKNDEKQHFGTHSIAQHSTAQHSIAQHSTA